MAQNIILTGPIGVGKSTIGKLISEKTKLPRISVDNERFYFYRQIGYDEQFADKLLQEKGFWALYFYWKEFECYTIEKILSQCADMVIDFGAGHSVYENDNQLNRVKKACEGNRVLLLLPCEEIEKSLAILSNRSTDESSIPDSDLNRHFLNHKSNRELSEAVFYTIDKTPEETAGEIYDYLQNTGK